MANPEIKSEAKDINDIVAMLDGFAMSDTGRLKVRVSEEVAPGEVIKAYHLGRCDIGSAFDCGTPFDVLGEDDDE